MPGFYQYLGDIIQRLTQFDYARGMAIIAVLVIHTTMYGSLATGNGQLKEGMYGIGLFVGFAVPLFIFISGYLLSTSYKKGFELRTFYRKRASSVLIPYILFACIYLMTLRTYGKDITLENATNSIITGSGLYQLYFVVLITQLYVIYPIFISILERTKGRASIAFILFSTILIGFTSTVLGAVFGTNAHNILTDGVGWVYFLSNPGILFFFVLGMVFGIHPIKNQLKTHEYLKIGGAILALIALYYISLVKIDIKMDGINIIQNSVISFTYCILAIFLCMYISTNIANRKEGVFARGLRRLGEYSFMIFLVFMLVNLGLIKIMAMFDIGYDDWIFYPALFAGTLLISYLSSRIIARTFFSGYLFGRTFRKSNSSDTGNKHVQ